MGEDIGQFQDAACPRGVVVSAMVHLTHQAGRERVLVAQAEVVIMRPDHDAVPRKLLIPPRHDADNVGHLPANPLHVHSEREAERGVERKGVVREVLVNRLTQPVQGLA